MSLGLLEVVTPVEGVHPGFGEELGPIAVSNHYAVGDHAEIVLADDEVGIAALEVRKRLDDAVWRHNGVILDHQTLQLEVIQHLALE